MRCIVTKAAEPIDVAHIYPFSMRNLRRPVSLPSFSFWAVLELFWSADRIKSWYESIFSTDSGTEIVPNLMCLCPNAHRYHERALFALKPIEVSEDKGKLRVQFYWLPRNKLSNSIDILTVPAIPDNENGAIHEIGLWNIKTDERIRSGYVLDIETEDPEKLPLPDTRLLDMQWVLNRVSALSGAAEPRDGPCDDDDDNWDDVALEHEYWHDDWSVISENSSPPSSPTSSPHKAVAKDLGAAPNLDSHDHGKGDGFLDTGGASAQIVTEAENHANTLKLLSATYVPQPSHIPLAPVDKGLPSQEHSSLQETLPSFDSAN
jgi:HNH endonuclease